MDVSDAFPALFWLHMNKGQYFSTLSKGFLTFCNLTILAIAFGIVGLTLDAQIFDMSANFYSTVRYGPVCFWKSH